MTGELTLRYDADDRYESARIAAIVRGDDERLRGVLWELCEDLRRVARGKQDSVGEAVLGSAQAEGLLDYIDGWLDGVPLSLEE